MVDAKIAGDKLKVFISYSRRDAADFADELVAGLELAGFAPFIDRHDIKAGELWEDRLGGLIAQSDTVVFVITPEAVKSERCNWEVERALELSKRLLPVVLKPVPESEIPEKLRRRNFVRFDTGRALTRSIAELAEALRLDLDWIREHTRLGELAIRWETRKQPEFLLLRGDDLDSAKLWTAKRSEFAPAVTDAQRMFIAASEDAESARLKNARAQLEATARQQRRAARLLLGIAALSLAMVGYVTWKDYDVAKREIAVFTARATDAMNEGQFDRAMRYALSAYPARGAIAWLTPFSTELEGKLAGGAQSSQLRRVLRGHSQPVLSVGFNFDGTRVLTTSIDHTARIWNIDSGKEVAWLKGHGGPVHRAAFSPDGKRVVTASSDLTARIWDVENGQEIVRLEHSNALTSVSFTLDGMRVVTTSSDNSARIWGVGGNEIARIEGDLSSLPTSTVSLDGTRLVTTSNNDALIWDTNSGNKLVALKGHTQPLVRVTISYNGKRALTTSWDMTARIWDTDSGNELAQLNGHAGQVACASFSSDGKRAVTSHLEKPATIWDADSGKKIAELKGHTDAVPCAEFSADGEHVVAASDDQAVRIWDAKSGREIGQLNGHTGHVMQARFSPNGKLLATASRDSTVRIWGADNGNVIRQVAAPNKIWTAKFNSDGKRGVATSPNRTAHVWSIDDGREAALLNGPSVRGAALSSDGRLLVTVAEDDNIARIFNIESRQEIGQLKGHIKAVTSAAFSSDGKRMVTVSYDRTARIWNLDSNTDIAIMQSNYIMRSAVFSPDDKRIVTTSDGDALIWDADSFKVIAELKGHTDQVLSATFSLDGKRLVTTSSDKTARAWNADNGKEIATFKGHTGAVTYATFSPDGRRLATLDQIARVWDVDSGKEIASLPGASGLTLAVAFSSDGKRLTTIHTNGTSRILDVTWVTLVRGDELRERVCAEKLIGSAQEFADAELEDPILRDIDKNNPVARNPCLRRGALSIDYWARLPIQVWRALRDVHL